MLCSRRKSGADLDLLWVVPDPGLMASGRLSGLVNSPDPHYPDLQVRPEATSPRGGSATSQGPPRSRQKGVGPLSQGSIPAGTVRRGAKEIGVFPRNVLDLKLGLAVNTILQITSVGNG